MPAPVANPPSTKKHEALVKLRRETQNKKLEAKQEVQQDDHIRAIK